MPETPDFEQIALGMLHAANGYDPLRSQIADALQAVWNARGAADAALIDQSLSAQMGSISAEPYVKNLTREIKALDR